MQPEQKVLYYITGGSESLLEIYKKKSIDVLVLDDDIDEIVSRPSPVLIPFSKSVEDGGPN